MDSRSKHFHLSTNSCYLAPVTREKVSDGLQLLCAVLDVPDLIVKVPKEQKPTDEVKCHGFYRTTVLEINSQAFKFDYRRARQCATCRRAFDFVHLL